MLSSSAVRAEQTCKNSISSTGADAKFSIYDEGHTIVDKTTGLMWMRCSLGQKWDGKTCSGTPAIFTWADALKTANGYRFASHDNWRLPNKNELESVVEGRCFSPAINTRIFPDTPSAYFWSSSPYPAVVTAAWSIDFGYGAVNASVKTGSIHVRLVRDTE